MRFKILLMIIFAGIYVVNGKKKSKIIGGKTVAIELHRSQVSLRWKDGHICAGSIISKSHILTTASCLLYELVALPANVEVLSGTNDQFDASNSDYLSQVNYVIYHPKYDPKAGWIHDICILKLVNPINYSNTRKNIDMPIFFLSAGNFPFTGWGDSYDLINNQHKRFLQVIYAKFQSTATCNRYFNEFHFTMSRSQGCVTSYEKDGLIEMGDSGGGVIHTVYINGIMSLHVPTIKNVFVYTKVWRYVRWIQETIEKY